METIVNSLASCFAVAVCWRYLLQGTTSRITGVRPTFKQAYVTTVIVLLLQLPLGYIARFLFDAAVEASSGSTAESACRIMYVLSWMLIALFAAMFFIASFVCWLRTKHKDGSSVGWKNAALLGMSANPGVAVGMAVFVFVLFKYA